MSKVLESRFQRDLINEIRNRLLDVVVMKMDSGYKQGVPDLLILHGKKWATLECKRDAKASHQPNQDWYVNHMNNMSFSRFIYPENKEAVLQDLITFLEDKEKTDEIQQPQQSLRESCFPGSV